LANKPLVIGLTGAFGSGKTSAANFFEEKGFKRIGLSDFLKDQLTKDGKSLTRKNFQDLGNELRRKNGPGYLAKKASEMIVLENLDKVTVDGLRNIGELDILRKNFNFVLIGVVADRQVRFNRIKNMKEREELTFNEFEELDRRDLGLTEEDLSGLQVAKCLALADYFAESNDEEAYPKKLEQILKKL
jgi:dephospho-CoA kinase